MQWRVLCQVQAAPPVMPSVSLPCLQDPGLILTACQNRALLRRHTTPMSPARLPPTPQPVFGKPTYTFHPQQTWVGALILHHPLLFSCQPPFQSLRLWGKWNANPALNSAPELWEHPTALCVDQLRRKMRPAGKSFNQGHHQSLRNGRPSGRLNPSTDPACCPALGDQWRAIWPSLLPSAGNREGSNEL